MHPWPCTVAMVSLSSAAGTVSRPWKESARGFTKGLRKFFLSGMLNMGIFQKHMQTKINLIGP